MERSEALVVGEPLHELGEALNMAGPSHLALAPSAQRLLSSESPVLHIKSSSLARTACQRLLKRPLVDFSSGYDWEGRAEILLGKVANRALELEAKLSAESAERSMSDNWCMAWAADQGSPDSSSAAYSAHALTTREMERVLSGSPPSPSSSLQNITLPTLPNGLQSLLRFMPSFVRPRCQDGEGLEALMEHRTVTSLFIIANMEVCVPPPGCQLPARRPLPTGINSAIPCGSLDACSCLCPDVMRPRVPRGHVPACPSMLRILRARATCTHAPIVPGLSRYGTLR